MDEEGSKLLRRYIFGLCMVALTFPMHHNLRQGCLLVRVPGRSVLWRRINFDGTSSSFEITHEKALAYAQTTVEEFKKRFPFDPVTVGVFDPKIAKEWIKEAIKKSGSAES